MAEKREFEAEIKRIDPKRLISESSDDVDDFFLVLALIFNDIKGLIIFGQLWADFYRKVRVGEVSAHAGEVGGLVVQRYKLMASLTDEFLKFLRKNADVLEKPRFNILVSRMSKEHQNKWRDLKSLATSNDGPKSSFAKAIAKVRNNIGFHYDHSRTQLKKAYIDFFNLPSTPGNDWAYYAIGTQMKSSRFYYADAAAMHYADIGEAENTGDDPEMLSQTVSDMNTVIWALLRAYLNSKHQDR